MKKLITILILCIHTFLVFAQAPQSFKYQAILRNTEGQIIKNEAVALKISILSQVESNEVAYSELHEVTTNSQGLIALNIGEGDNLSGSFDEIKWGSSKYNLSLELDYNNSGYALMGRSPLLSVPYALHAETANNVDDADADPNNEIQTISFSNDTLYLTKGGSVVIKNGTSFSGDYNDLANTPTPGGDISGTIDSLTVNKLRGHEISSNIPANGQVLKWNESEQKWMPDEDGLGEAGTMDGVVSSVGIEGSTTKTISFNRSNGLGTLTATFNDEVNDADADPTNEIQSLSYANDTLFLTSGGAVKIGNKNFSGSYNDLTDVPDNFDTDSTNEIQKLSIIGNTLSLDKNGGNVTIPAQGWGGITDEALFAVVNKIGDTVFAVYEGGVRIYVDDNQTKAARGGFAVATRNATKGASQEILTVSKESVNIYLDSTGTKAARGGFAVATRNATKGSVSNLMTINLDSTRIYVEKNNSKAARGGFAVATRNATKGSSDDIFSVSNQSVDIILDSTSSKAARGGFAIATRNATKSSLNNLMTINADSTRIYVDESGSKAARGGFAVATRNATKSGNKDILSVTSDSTRIYIGNDEAGFGVENTSSGKKERLMRLERENYFIGHQAGNANSNGLYNTFLGYQSGSMHSTGNNNIYIGYQSAFNDISGQNNIIIGYKAGYNNTSGSENLFIGDSSGYHNSDGKGHVFLGYNAGVNNTTGDTNTFVGYKAGQTNTSGYGNAFFGTSSGYNNTTGYRNVFSGPNTGYKNSTGRENVFVGFAAGYSNTEGYYNTFLGKGAGLNNTTGNQSTFVGVHAGTFNTTGYNNTFFGSDAGTFNTTGSSNAFFGSGSGYKNTTGINNTCIGTGSGFENSTGQGNIFIGTNAGYTTVGDSNVFIGYFAGFNATGSNQLYIDNSDTSTPLIFGNFTDGFEQVEINGNFVVKEDFWVNGTAGGSAAWNDFSDKRLKKNISAIPNALNRVMQLRGINYEWKDTLHPENGRIKMGFIAQEALEVIPEVVNKNGEYYSMQYAPITAILVEATKEQQQIIENQNKTISIQAQEIDTIKAQYNALQSEIEKLKQMILEQKK